VFCAYPNFLSCNCASSSDNSGQNKSQTATADNQSNVKADWLTTAQVRKAIVADRGLSTYGHNVKIITANGTVTLKGPTQIRRREPEDRL
jgi:hyperosmotically inducible periplasmic protein